MKLFYGLLGLLALCLAGAVFEPRWQGAPEIFIQIHGALLLVLALVSTALLASVVREHLESSS